MLKYTVPDIDARRAFIDHDARHIVAWAYAAHAALIRTQAHACREAAFMLEATIKRLHNLSIQERERGSNALKRGQYGLKPEYENITRTRDLMPFFLLDYDRFLLGGSAAESGEDGRFIRNLTTAEGYALALAFYRHDARAPFITTVTAQERARIRDHIGATVAALRLIKREGRPIATYDLNRAVAILTVWREYADAERRAARIWSDKTRLITAKKELNALAQRAEDINLNYGADVPITLYDVTEAERGRITRHAREYLYFYLIALKKIKRYAAKRASRTYSDAPAALDTFDKAAAAARCPKHNGLCFMCAWALEQEIKARLEAAARDSLGAYKWESARIRAEALHIQIIERWF
jgi:hypothetical protein